RYPAHRPLCRGSAHRKARKCGRRYPRSSIQPMTSRQSPAGPARSPAASVRAPARSCRRWCGRQGASEEEQWASRFRIPRCRELHRAGKWTPCCDLSINAEKLFDAPAVRAKRIRRSRMRDITSIQDDDVVGDLQGKLDILLDEDDRQTAVAKPLQDGGYLCDDLRGETFG